MRKMYRTTCMDPQFWTAVVAGWIICVLIWKNDPDLNSYGKDLTTECPPCVDRICPKCAAEDGKAAGAKEIARNEFYRDFAWKPQNVVEGESNSWRMHSRKHRDGMTNEDPRVGLNGMWRMELDEVDEYLTNVIKNTDRSDSIDKVEFKRMMRKSDPFSGVSYIVNVGKKHNEKEESIPGAYEVRRKFKSGTPNLIDIKHMDHKEMIYVITPLSKVSERFHKFLKRLEDNIYSTKRATHEKLIFVIFGDQKSDDVIKTVSALKAFQLRNPTAIMQHTVVSGDFSRAIGLDTGVKMCPDDGLMLFLDVDLSITPEFLNRVRENTIQHERVTFPIMFSQFDPDVIQEYKKTMWVPPANEDDDSSAVGGDKGFWIHYAFGVASMYKSDYLSVGGFPLDIVGWGGEDVALLKKFVSNQRLDVMSIVDPDLIHIYHSRACDVALAPDQYRMCIGALSETIGSQTQVGSLYLDNKRQEYFGGMFG